MNEIEQFEVPAIERSGNGLWNDGALEHFARSVWLSRYSPENTVMVLDSYSGYFDASGSINEHEIIVVAGFVSTVRKWNSFDRSWRKTLNKFGVPYLHMKEFGPSNGVFKGWNEQEAKRRNFLKGLLRSIIDNVEYSFAAAVFVEDYNTADREYAVKEALGAPYALCGESCAAWIEEWCSVHGAEFPLLMFEKGDQGKGDLIDALSLHGVAHSFGDKLEIARLQAADLLAYEIFKASSSVLRGSVADFRKPFKTLRKAPGSWKMFEIAGIYDSCVDLGVPRRDGLSKDELRKLRESRKPSRRELRKLKAVDLGPLYISNDDSS